MHLLAHCLTKGVVLGANNYFDSFFKYMKPWRIKIAIGVLVIVLSIIYGLKPMSVNVLNYLVWKYSGPIKAQIGSIDYQGAHIHYVSYGHGSPLLLLHGGLSNKLSWFSQVPWLVESGRQVILIDTRGHGYSTHGDAKLTYEIFAEDTLQVLNQLGIQRTDIIGWSDGGIIALLLGLHAPDRIGKIVAISANFHPSGVILEADSTQKYAYGSIFKTLKDKSRAWWSGAGDKHAELETEINELWHAAPQMTHTHLNSITAPTLVVVGENDLIDLGHSRELAQKVAQGRLEIIPQAGHAAPITHADELNKLISVFLDIKQ